MAMHSHCTPAPTAASLVHNTLPRVPLLQAAAAAAAPRTPRGASPWQLEQSTAGLHTSVPQHNNGRESGVTALGMASGEGPSV